MSLSLLDREIVTDDLEEIWAESSDDIPCSRYSVCKRNAQISVIWEKCHNCNAPGGRFNYCLGCWDHFLFDVKTGKPFNGDPLGPGGRWGSCDYCVTGFSQPLIVNTVR